MQRGRTQPAKQQEELLSPQDLCTGEWGYVGMFMTHVAEACQLGKLHPFNGHQLMHVHLTGTCTCKLHAALMINACVLNACCCILQSCTSIRAFWTRYLHRPWPSNGPLRDFTRYTDF
jgi:hypothetical protein